MFLQPHHFDTLTKEQLHENRTYFLFLGICSTLVGAAALYFSLFSTLITVFALGIVLVSMGIFETIQSLGMRAAKNFFLHLCLGVLYTVGGVFIIMHPLVSEVNLTLLLAFFFMVGGMVRAIFAITHSLAHKGLNVLQGIISFVLGLLIWQQWPESGLWVMGMFAGINALMTGWTWLLLAYVASHTKK